MRSNKRRHRPFYCSFTTYYYFQTTVIYNNYLAGRWEELFKCPLEYKPERWLNEDLGKIHPFASLPFGVG